VRLLPPLVVTLLAGVILVKLHQFDLRDRTHVVIDTNKMKPIAPAGRSGVSIIPLFSDGAEDVRIEFWEPNAAITLDLPSGGEFFVISGTASEGADSLEKWSWLRLPPGASLDATAGPDGCKLWVKTDHLTHIDMSRYEKM